MEPFADYLRVTTPKDDSFAVREELEAVLSGVVGSYANDGFYALCDGGGIGFQERSNVFVVWITGKGLQVLREQGLYGEVLMAFGSVPHNVSAIDAALDIPVSDPEAYIRSFHARATSSPGIRLSRKAVRASHVQLRESKYPDGVRNALTVYLGRRTANYRCRIYDKRGEMLSRRGVDIGLDVVRVEVTVGRKSGASLRDAYDPVPLFYHLASPDLVPCPSEVPSWSPSSEGFTVEKRPTVLPAVKCKRVVESSHDLRVIAKLASEMGPMGVEYASHLASERIRVLAEAYALAAEGRAA